MNKKINVGPGTEGAFILSEDEDYRIASMGWVVDPTKDAVPDSPNFINNVQVLPRGEFDGKRFYKIKNNNRTGIVIEVYKKIETLDP